MRVVFKNHIPIIVAPRLFGLLRRAFGFDVGAVTVFPFIIVRDDAILNNPAYINHESIHIYQHIETLLVGFWIIGALQYVYALVFLKKSRLQAYYYMSHEQEAHQNDENLDYLKTRRWFSYYQYLFPKNRKKMDLVQGKRVIDWS